MASTDRFVYMAHHFILLRVKPFSLRVDRDGWFLSTLVIVPRSLVSRGCQKRFLVLAIFAPRMC